MKKIMIAVFMMFFILFSIQGCNTVKGVGKDIEKAGEAIQKTTN
ncbi:MAG: entericidin A/B family lipoprotein [Desulfamplus sp.]|nr:entericidin A/B family lipoprotein [Desulfamplus sp.]